MSLWGVKKSTCHPQAPVKLLEINRADASAFVDLLGGVFEHSAWVAEGAWTARPFSSVGHLHEAMMSVVRNASHARQLELVRAHPELAGSEACEGMLTLDSTSEQGRLGFTALSKKELLEMAGLNRRYREKFGFPCIVALRLHATQASVIEEIERRLGNNADTELKNALEQIGHIAHGRLAKLFGES